MLDAGTIRKSILLEEDGAAIALDRSITPLNRDGAVVAVTLIQAADLDAAIEIAKSFPGIAFGTTVEVRAVKPLPAPR